MPDHQSIFPLVVAGTTLTAWDGFSYVDELGRTYWSGAAEPSEADALDALEHQELRRLGASRDSLLLRAKQRRREVEEGGITLDNGAKIATDRESQAMLDGALSLASLSGLGAQFTTQWKCADGEFRTVTHAELMAAALAVGMHVQACFSRESALVAQITGAQDGAQLMALVPEVEAFELT